MNVIEDNYTSAIKQVLDDSSVSVFHFWKGRVAFYALLRALGVQAEDEVIIPAFTCVVVPNAVIYLGAVPKYVDISPVTYNMTAAGIEQAITDRTKVIVCQNTFGLSSELQEIKALADSRGIATIEDCTHGFGGRYDAAANGTICDSAFFSTQWNKPYSTGIGGFAITRDPAVAAALEQLQQELVDPTFSDKLNLKTLYAIRKYLINDFTYWPMVKLYRVLSKLNIVLGSSSGEELVGPEAPKDFFKSASAIQCANGLNGLKSLPKLLAERKQTAQWYTEFLRDHGKTYVSESLNSNHSFLRYAALVHDRDAFLRKAEAAKVEIGDWFLSPLHPITTDLSPWQLDVSQFPTAARITRQIVNLPTSPNDFERVRDFLVTNLDDLI